MPATGQELTTDSLAAACDLVPVPVKRQIAPIGNAAKPEARRRCGKSQEPQVVLYRGIRIAPINGRRSPLSRLIREGLRARFAQPRDDATPA